MNKQILKTRVLVTSLMAGIVAFGLAGCGSNSNNSSNAGNSVNTVMAHYQVSVSNVSYAQPLSPLALILHDQSYQGWDIGMEASMGLETMAEGGDNSLFLNEADENGMAVSFSGDGVVAPGETVTLDIEATAQAQMQLTLASMLINTNDAFTGSSGIELNDLAVGEVVSYPLPVYDAGTEANTELAGTIPGPADGGEGMNMTRDDLNKVSRHPGLATRSGGNLDSVLDQSHRFDSPVAILQITRLE